MSVKANELLETLESIGLFNYSPQSGDEQDFVDRRVVMEVLLPWLGWEGRDYEYNRMNAGSKPDFLVRAGTIVVFFIEDKATAESLAGHESQILEYLKKFSRKGIVCNGFHLWVVELQGSTFKVSYEIDFKKAKDGLFAEEEKSEIERLYREFSKEKFINLESRIKSLASEKEEFLERAVDVDGREEVFMDEAYSIIEEIYFDVYGKLKNALRRFNERRFLTEEGERKVQEALDKFLGADPGLTERRGEVLERIRKRCLKVLRRLGYLTPEEIAEVENVEGRLREMEKKRLRDLIETIKVYNSRLQEFQVLYSDELSLAESFFLWLEGWREFLSHSTEGNGESESGEETFKEYSLQVAYTFFVKVFILRVLEDKGLMGRILSDGGFSLWKRLTENLSLIGNNGEMRFNLLFALAVRHVREKMFSDIEKNKVYDWYIPDDMLFLKLLELMNKYNFRNVKQDIIGYVYEKLMEKVHRHELGIYLTPPEIVDYMLDRIGYRGREVIGKKFIDPACGSGTFLVHAVRRYREALKEASVENLEEKFIRDVQENFGGVDMSMSR